MKKILRLSPEVFCHYIIGPETGLWNASAGLYKQGHTSFVLTPSNPVLLFDTLPASHGSSLFFHPVWDFFKLMLCQHCGV